MDKFKRITQAVLLLIWFSSCEKFLEQNPDVRTDIKTIDQVADLVTSAYPKVNQLAMAETASDNVCDKGPGYGHLDEPYPSLYFWRDNSSDGINTPTDYWNAAYAAIAAANHALEAIELNDFGDEVLPYKGEALIARAYSHWMLVTYFAKAYVAGGDNSSAGIPYVTKPETEAFAQYDRGTVASVYENIKKDLEEGIALLSGGEWQVPKYHFTPSSAHAFAARFYLFTGEWQKVIDHANMVFPDGNYVGKIRPFNSIIKAYSIEEYAKNLTMADKEYNLLLRESYSTYQRYESSGTTRYGFGTVKFQGVYNATTMTGGKFYNKGLYWEDNSYTVYIFNEYFYYVDLNAGIGYPYIMQPLFLADEALMNRAEAYIQLGNYTNALVDLNYFASTRVDNYNATTHAVTIEKAKAFFNLTDDKQALIQTVLQFKQIAFMGEGIRWFDILRHRIPVVHNVIEDNGAESTLTLEADDKRRMFQLPETASLAGLEMNPR